MSFKVNPSFVMSLFGGPLLKIILIEPEFLNVRKRHIYNLGGHIRILNHDQFLVPFHFLDKLFEDGFARKWFLHSPIDFLDIVIFQFRVLGDKVSQNL